MRLQTKNFALYVILLACEDTTSSEPKWAMVGGFIELRCCLRQGSMDSISDGPWKFHNGSKSPIPTFNINVGQTIRRELQSRYNVSFSHDSTTLTIRNVQLFDGGMLEYGIVEGGKELCTFQLLVVGKNCFSRF